MRRPLPRPLLVLAALVAPLGCRGQGPQPADAGAPPAAALQPAFDPAAIGPGAPPKPGPARPLDVRDHGPVGRSEGGVDIHVRFNQPVVALELTTSALGCPRSTAAPPAPRSTCVDDPCAPFHDNGQLARAGWFSSRDPTNLPPLDLPRSKQ